jgi:large subunit ribosomal protein L27
MARRRSPGCVANGRDSPGQRLGLKVWGGQTVKSGSLILRQRGTRFYPGTNAALGRDHTIFATAPGRVAFTRSQGGRRTVSVVSAEAPKS